MIFDFDKGLFDIIKSPYIEDDWFNNSLDNWFNSNITLPITNNNNITLPITNQELNLTTNEIIVKYGITLPITNQELNLTTNEIIVKYGITLPITNQELNLTTNEVISFALNVNNQLYICAIDDINIKAVFDNEFPIPLLEVNQGVSNNGVLNYNTIFSNAVENSLVLDWVDYTTVRAIQDLNENVNHFLYICNCGGKLCDIKITSVDVEEIYRGALWYNVKINFTRKI